MIPRIKLTLDSRDKYYKFLVNDVPLSIEAKRGELTAKEILELMVELCQILGISNIVEEYLEE